MEELLRMLYMGFGAVLFMLAISNLINLENNLDKMYGSILYSQRYVETYKDK